MILAGGKGSRLAPFTFTIPKPLVPIGEYPIIEILIRQLAAQGFEKITISVGHLASLVQAYCEEGQRWGIPIDYVFEKEPLGTVGGLSLIEDLGEDRILVVNGDTLTDLDMAAALAAHASVDALTICVNRRSVDIDFGVIDTNGRGYLTSYREKPELSYKVSMGVNVVSCWAIEKYISFGQPLDFPELVEKVVADGQPIRVLEEKAFWLDLGRMADLEAGTKAFQANPRQFLPE